ncbi:MAG TPA: glycosyltransferase [Xanthobacteraceae bacterium]|jgi:glycosyltransferase involved in cell wall biosynthesis
MRFQQILITRYNVALSAAAAAAIDPFSSDWMAHRDLLFRRYCVASVCNQTHREFDWFVLFHPDTPRGYLDFIDGVAVPIPARTTGEGIGIIQREHIRSDTVVASRMDNDDAIAAHFMRQVKVTVDGALRDGFGGGRPFLVSFRNGIVAHSPSGRWRSHSHPSAPFLTLVEPLTAAESWISPLGIDHNDALDMFPVISVDNKEPAWAMVVHERNLNNRSLWGPSTIAHGKLPTFPRLFPRHPDGAVLAASAVRAMAQQGRRVARWAFRRARSLALGLRRAPPGLATTGAAEPRPLDQHALPDRATPASLAKLRGQPLEADAGNPASAPWPSVDVVIPVRNGARFIQACLDSVRAQTLPPRSVVVVDDGSTDDTPDILERNAAHWPKLHMLRTNPRGASHARNTGIATSAAPFVAFLDSDDVWHPEKLERQMSLFHQPQVGFVHCGMVQIDQHGDPLPGARIYAPSKQGDVLRPMLEDFYHIIGSASAVVARRALIVKAGGFDETLMCGEDLDLWLKLAQLSHVEYVTDALVSLRVHSGSTCRNAIRRNPELVLFQRLKIWNKWIHHVADRRRVIETFRHEAATVGRTNAFRHRPDFGLYGRLKRSNLELAKRLFSSRRDYLHAMSPLPPAYERAKLLVARHLILRSRLLLGFCRALGKFQD